MDCKRLLITKFFFSNFRSAIQKAGSKGCLLRLYQKAVSEGHLEKPIQNVEFEGCCKRLNWKASLKGCLKRPFKWPYQKVISNGHVERLNWKTLCRPSQKTEIEGLTVWK